MSETSFERMHRRLFARLGREALLRGVATPVIIDRDVDIVGEHGEIVGRRDTATFPSDTQPKKGDALTLDGRSYLIDSRIEDDGHVAVCILLPD